MGFCHLPNWLSYFSEGFKPPTSLIREFFPEIIHTVAPGAVTRMVSAAPSLCFDWFLTRHDGCAAAPCRQTAMRMLVATKHTAEGFFCQILVIVILMWYLLALLALLSATSWSGRLVVWKLSRSPASRGTDRCSGCTTFAQRPAWCSHDLSGSAG